MITPAPANAAAISAAMLASLLTERAALVSAIASGVRSVSYEGKSASYDDLAGMKMRLNFIDAQIAPLTGAPARKPQAGFANFSRGYNDRASFNGGFYGYRG